MANLVCDFVLVKLSGRCMGFGASLQTVFKAGIENARLQW